MTIVENLKAQYEESKRIINNAVRNHQLVIFVGAGASVASGLPSWNMATEEIASRLNNTDNLDNLRIPQYYFNARGKKEYTQLMRDIFKYNSYIQINQIHDRIIKFNVDTIITTNYDSLIEQAAEENNEVVEVISKDSDLAYRTGRKELIKMHGDFVNDNFVLKEDDYLSYSSNFKLIENYIKSIIGTKVVLFIGYSFNDPDVKQIFTWTKDILKGDFQRAYLIESGKSYDVNEYEYFKNFGINVLYSSIISGNGSSDDLTNNTIKVLDWLLAQPEKDDLSIAFEELRVFDSFLFVSGKYIQKAMRNLKFFDVDDSNTLRCSIRKRDEIPNSVKVLLFVSKEQKNNNEELFNQIVGEYAPSDDDLEKARFVLKIIKKSPISTISLLFEDKKPHGEVLNIEIEHNFDDPVFNAAFCFDFKKLKEIASKYHTQLNDEGLPERTMEYGFIEYLLFDYLKSYNCFVQAKKIFYKQKKYVQYFIAEYSQYYLAKTITAYGGITSGIADEELKRINNELKAINLERTFRSICGGGESYEVLRDLYTFTESYRVFQSAYKTSENVRKQANMNSIAYWGSFAYDELRTKIHDYYLFIQLNHFPINHFFEHVELFKMYFNTILDSVVAPNKMKINEDRNYVSGNIRADGLTAFDLMVIFNYVSVKELKDKLEVVNTIVGVDEEAIEYLGTVINNCTNENPVMIMRNDGLFWKIITFLGYCKLNESIVKIALEKLCSNFNWKISGIFDNPMLRFLQNAYTQLTIDESVIPIIIKYLHLELDKCLSSDSKSNLSIIRFILYVLREYNHEYDDIEFIEKHEIKEENDSLLYLYECFGGKIKRFIKNKYKDTKISNANDFDKYYYLVINRIIKPDLECENRISGWLVERNSQNKKIKTPFSLLDNTEEQLTYQLIDLYLNNLLLNKEVIQDIIPENEEYYSWLLNYKNYNYDVFDFNWLTSCPMFFLQKISDVNSVRQIIRRKLVENYNQFKNDQNLVEIFFKYFA